MTARAWRTYSTTVTLTPLYSLGFTAALVLVVLVITGWLLSSAYCANSESLQAIWDLVETNTREQTVGWLCRSLHACGASLFLGTIYAHLLRAAFHSSHATRPHIWTIGVILLLLASGAAFTGYTLVAGQMSYWAVVVITNLIGVLPGNVGQAILTWLWGSSTVTAATMGRMYSLHFLLPLVVVCMVAAHLLVLHSTNSTGEQSQPTRYSNLVPFYPLLMVRDVVVGALGIAALAISVGWWSVELGHPDNFLAANPLVTPSHIQPEWYFLPYYGLLRAYPSKPIGILSMLLAIVALVAVTNRTSWTSWNVRNAAHHSQVILLGAEFTTLSWACIQVNGNEQIYLLLTTSVLSSSIVQVTPRVNSYSAQVN